ncbi:MAG: 2-oxoacid:ferredoxin oxidoreductase subunit beta [Candidatus Thermoplasmatota archaeon]|jgi:2-oxoglutarate ferredoxin oxidoreductase subunit beta|nr:2-oxoacid:ferredoxin oxidoreductase subunit beta [Candidatus Thermoplasmatota archaeon]
MNEIDYKSDVKPTWCPGCGDYGVLNSIIKAAKMLSLKPENTVIVSGIGCSSNLPHFFNSYSLHSIHGRAVAVAEGIKFANHELNVIVTGGDGDGYGIGLNHMIHAMRRNVDITYVVMDNEIYGLTTGQSSPTSMLGHKTKSTPFGVIETPVNPIAQALSASATYVARGFSGDPGHLAELIKGGISHKGFALIDVFSPCVTFNKINTYDWFRKNIYKLEGNRTDDFTEAMKHAKETERLPIGLFYKTDTPTYEERDLVLKKSPLIKQDRVDNNILEKLMEEFA